MKRLVTLALILGSFYVTAQKIPFQGKLTENDEPVTGAKTFIFGFASVGWEETHENVSILDGYYSVVLGSITPIPDSLFDKSDVVELSINVDGTDLSPVQIYAPIGSKTGRFVITESTDTVTTALTAINCSTGTNFGTGSRLGAYIEAKGEGLNTGLFAYAENGRSINNQSELTDPEVYTTGQLSSLYGNSNVGGRALQSQYTATGGGHGVGLSGYAGGGGMNWGVWGRANSFQSDSIQVGGHLEAYGTGSNEHYGVRGIASGDNSARNVGVYGAAYNSPNENWAGWFDGAVNVNGELIVNGSSIGGGISTLDTIVSRDLKLLNESGNMRAHLNIYSTDAGSLVLNAPNDSTNVILGSSGDGFDGSLYLYDSLRNNTVQLRSRKNGGYLQLAKYNNGTANFESAVVAGASNSNSFLSMYGQNATSDGIIQMVDNYITGNQIGVGNTNPLLNGYRRSGTDWKANDDRVYAAIGNAGTEAGDESGFSGYLSLWGTSTFNVELTGKRWQNNDLPTLAMYGTNDDGNGWYASNFRVNIDTASGNMSYADITFNNSFNGGTTTETIFISGNHNQTGAGGLDLRDATGANRISLNGSGGNISANRTDGGSAANFFVGADNGGISIQNSSDVNKFFYEAGAGNLQLKNDANLITLDLQGNSGNLYVRGDNNTAGDDIRVGIEVIADGAGSSNGRFFVKDSTSTDVVRLEKNGDIYASGTVFSGGIALTSDKRYKKNIQTLTGALDKTRELRGTSYYWKDQSRGASRQIGVIAQEVEEVYPEFVHTNADGYKSVNYAQMVAVLIEAVKELDAKISSLEKENGELKAELAANNTSEIETLKSEIESIKQILSLKIDKSETVGENK